MSEGLMASPQTDLTQQNRTSTTPNLDKHVEHLKRSWNYEIENFSENGSYQIIPDFYVNEMGALGYLDESLKSHQ